MWPTLHPPLAKTTIQAPWVRSRLRFLTHPVSLSPLRKWHNFDLLIAEKREAHSQTPCWLCSVLGAAPGPAALSSNTADAGGPGPGPLGAGVRTALSAARG